jgi:hypothetical protein
MLEKTGHTSYNLRLPLLKGNGITTGYLGIVVDISSIKAAEKRN